MGAHFFGYWVRHIRIDEHTDCTPKTKKRQHWALVVVGVQQACLGGGGHTTSLQPEEGANSGSRTRTVLEDEHERKEYAIHVFEKVFLQGGSGSSFGGNGGGSGDAGVTLSGGGMAGGGGGGSVLASLNADCWLFVFERKLVIHTCMYAYLCLNVS